MSGSTLQRTASQELRAALRPGHEPLGENAVTAKIRRATSEDADFIAWTILTAQRGHRPRGWFDIALGWPEPLCHAFVRRIALAQQRSWWHASHFLIAEADGGPPRRFAPCPRAGPARTRERRLAR